MISSFIGMGSNQSDPVTQLKQALLAMDKIPNCVVGRVSSLYSSRPMGPADQPDYINAVIELKTNLSPNELLKCLQQIELQQGRVRKDEQWGPRTLDLDIIFYGDLLIEQEDLVIPHYGYRTREFVLYPLSEIDAEMPLPDGEILSGLIHKVPLNGLTKLENTGFGQLA